MAHNHDEPSSMNDEGDADDGFDELQECVEECLNCHVICTMTMQHALAAGGEHASIDVVGVLLDCAEMCQVNATFMLRGSPYYVLTATTCAELCRACAETCRMLEGDEAMVACAEVCESCAESCDEMTEMIDMEEAAEGGDEE